MYYLKDSTIRKGIKLTDIEELIAEQNKTTFTVYWNDQEVNKFDCPVRDTLIELISKNYFNLKEEHVTINGNKKDTYKDRKL